MDKCSCCETEILPGEWRSEIEQDGEKGVVCALCVERVFNETMAERPLSVN